ncbi:hypothetical protein [Cohnella abietis]|uniref:Permease n=1 Tax=Cohnella abietis TaxID=2507935 RepID=A0A3T1D7Q2_9BACL|nr:hypothetical protein [Cohnella abietis]BBI34112.1 hypothetical protein KCTCHS21_35110 [Cohnella abietis]
MTSERRANTEKPMVVVTTQILLYLAAIVNVGNGIISLSSDETIKIILSVVMIAFGLAAAWVAARLGVPEASRLNTAVTLSVILIVLRIVEFSVWHSVGFLLGVILPVIVIWRLRSPEAKSWFSL